MTLFERILVARGLDGNKKDDFLFPKYPSVNDPFLLPDMAPAVERLKVARDKQENIVIYGDYDIDGLTAASLLADAMHSLGFENVDIFIPNRFIDGYGMNVDAVKSAIDMGATLMVTVDCGSSSVKEIDYANKNGLDVIVTDHHELPDKLPSAIAVINPKRNDSKYPFIDLAGVGVAFKLVQALRTEFSGIDEGQEKWLLDLVALGTVCDIVDLVDENRINVYWGLKVLSQTRRPGLKALMAIAGIDPKAINARSLGFGLGPRMNASGRLETAQYSLDLLTATDPMVALQKAEHLDAMNKSRRADQDSIMKQAVIQADKYSDDPVLVVSDAGWNHGIVGIVASKLMERYGKPAFVIQELGKESKGSARSYGDFSAIDAVNHCQELITKGGGHKFAAGISLPTTNIISFRKKINDYYRALGLANQHDLLLPKPDATAKLSELDEVLVVMIDQLEPFGSGNPRPIFKTENLMVKKVKLMGSDSQHVKLELQDQSGISMQFISFNSPDHFIVPEGSMVSAWFHISLNEWRGNRSVEGQLLHLEPYSK
ncbi:single-stranded-DNA-specific exonuclease RecJ [Candidatus Saccharibacteria bacterium]|nr:single-stranded-DNA-specific exonuclease RecJ [Candidatus Saccharibacteria bacterium]